MPTIPKNINLPNNTKSINVHLNLSDLLKNPGANTSEENVNLSNASTESNIINVSSPRTTNKPTRKNVEPPQIPENKNLATAKTANMPIIRNILYRRKMSYLNRKLPLDFEQIAFDTLGISEINKNPEDLIFDNEDSLQVEESSHDKLIYYDVKNNSSKKSGNNFEDASDEIKTMSIMNKTFNSNTNKKNITFISTTTGSAEESNESSTNSSNLDDIVVLLNTTEATATTTITPQKVENKTEETKTLHKNNTRFMSPSLYNYFRPLDVPEEEMQPFLHFGDKLTNIKPNQSPKLPEKKKPEETQKNEEEIHENMDVLADKAILIENKITKMNLPNQKVNAARDYYKSRNQNKSLQKNTTETPSSQKQKTVAQLRNTTRNRGFRNQTIFYQNKRNGVRQTINLRGNVTLSDLKPSTVITEITTDTPVVSSTENQKIVKLEKITAENTTEVVTPQSKSPETSTLAIVASTKAKNVPQTSTPVIETKTTVKNDDLITSSTKYLVDSTTSSAPTTRILSTAVVTSVSVKSKPKNGTKDNLQSTEHKVQTTTDINDSDATVVAALSNFTLQAFQNNTKVNNTTSSRNPATVYPSIDIPLRNISKSGNNGLYAHHLEYAVPQRINGTASSRVQTTQTTPKTKFILRPHKRTTTQQAIKSTTTEFVINVEDDEQTDTAVETTKLDLETFTPKVLINSRFGSAEILTTTPTPRTPATRTRGTITLVPKTPVTVTPVPITPVPTTPVPTTPVAATPVAATPVTTTPVTTPVTTTPVTTTIKSPTITSSATPSTTTTPVTTTSAKTKTSTSSTTTITTPTSTTTEESSPTTTKPPNRTFNTTMLSKPDAESELPLATLFSVTDFKKPENQTRQRSPAIETVISRKSENEVSLDNIHAAYILAALGFLPMMVIVIYVVRSVMKKKHKNIEDFEAEMHHDSEKKSIIHPVARLPTLVLDTSNRWEFPRGKLRLQTLLGQGNFGQVRVLQFFLFDRRRKYFNQKIMTI